MPFPSGRAARYVGEIAACGTPEHQATLPAAPRLRAALRGAASEARYPDAFGCPLRASEPRCRVLSPRRYFRCPADSSELAYDPPVVMNADTLGYCQKEAWCKLAFYLLSFFYYLYW